MVSPGHWFGSLTWTDSGGGEHSWSQHHSDHTQVLSSIAVFFDMATNLAEALEEEPDEPLSRTAPDGSEIVRHLWRVVLTYQEPDGTEHTHRGLEVTGEAAWRAAVDAHERLVDLRELLRQVYGPRPPRPLGEEAPTW
jgi:hypothetical protein